MSQQELLCINRGQSCGGRRGDGDTAPTGASDLAQISAGNEPSRKFHNHGPPEKAPARVWLSKILKATVPFSIVS